MKRQLPLLTILLILLAVGCQDLPTETQNKQSPELVYFETPKVSGVVNRVTASSPGFCDILNPRDCKSGYNLSAVLNEDGTVTGGWYDPSANGGRGLQAVAHCLKVVGNQAIIGGETFYGPLAIPGRPVVIAVEDNGRSGDRVSPSIFPVDIPCSEMEPSDLNLLDVPGIRVRVR